MLPIFTQILVMLQSAATCHANCIYADGERDFKDATLTTTDVNIIWRTLFAPLNLASTVTVETLRLMSKSFRENEARGCPAKTRTGLAAGSNMYIPNGVDLSVIGGNAFIHLRNDIARCFPHEDAGF